MGIPKVVRMKVEKKFINNDSTLPFGVTVSEVVETVNSVYAFLFDMDSFLVNKEYPCLSDLILGNTFSGVVSEVIVKTLSDASPALVRNEYIGGHPDLLPTSKGYSKGSAYLKAPEGIEVKTSKQKGGWQGHNTEGGWFIIFRYTMHEAGLLATNPTLEFVEVLAAEIDSSDWSFSGRKGKSRRTPTASILKSGTSKLRSNAIIRNPNYLVRR